MILTIQQGLVPRAGAAQNPRADLAEAPEFLAELVAQDDKTTAAPDSISAEASLVAGLIVPAPPSLQTAVPPGGHAAFSAIEGAAPSSVALSLDPAIPHLPANTIARPDPGSVDVTEGAALPTAPAQATAMPPVMASPRQDGTLTPPVMASENVAAAESLLRGAQNPARSDLRNSIAADPVRFGKAAHAAVPTDPPAVLAAAEQPATIAADPPWFPAKAAQTSAVMAPQAVLSPVQPTVPTPAKPGSAAAIAGAALQPDAAQPLASPSQDDAFSAVAPAVATVQTPQTDAEPAAPKSSPVHISTAESAWQTVLYRDAPQAAADTARALTSAEKSPGPPTQHGMAAPQSAPESPLPPPPAVAAPAVAAPAVPAPAMSPRALPTPSAATRASDAMSAQIPKPPAVAAPSTDHAENRAPDLLPATTLPAATLPATTPPVPLADQAAIKAANPVATATPHPAAAQPAPLQPAVSAQLMQHTAAASTGGVAVLLQPEELGHVKFQIQHQGDSVRILLSAERPETVELLRRHSDQLLQEFRQSGFSQASLSFGQWGEQQRPPAAPLAAFTRIEAEAEDTSQATSIPHSPQNLAPERGLNLRL